VLCVKLWWLFGQVSCQKLVRLVLRIWSIGASDAMRSMMSSCIGYGRATCSAFVQDNELVAGPRACFCMFQSLLKKLIMQSPQQLSRVGMPRDASVTSR
jgi:hypothetical protein